MNKSKYVIGYISYPVNHESFQSFVKGMVEEQKLVACCQAMPKIQSMYTWKGKLEVEEETLLVLKTKASLTSKIIDYVNKHHPYDTAEVVFTDITTGNPAYLKWIDEVTLDQTL
mmetsp:Transcript_11699/g.17365  ORF Transcript_11699/g.17365 Transcript_11699/m.17365 type:complete len:114 (-) Transcript_11699:1924-2265(-)